MSRRLVWAFVFVGLAGIPAQAPAQTPFAADAVPNRTALARLGLERQWLAVIPVAADERVLNAHHAAFLVARGRIPAAHEAIVRAFHDRFPPSSMLAEAALTRALVARMEGRDDRPALGKLKALFARGFGRDFWFTDGLVEAAKRKLSFDDVTLYRSLVDAILSSEKVTALEDAPRWNEIMPIALDQVMPPDGGSIRVALA